MFLLEIEHSSGGGSTGSTSKQRKWLLAVRIFFAEMTLMLFYPFFHSYLYGENISEVGKDRYIKKRLSQMLLESYSLHKTYQ